MARLRAEDAERRAASGYGPDFLEAFARGLRVISAFGREKKHMTLSDVARATDLPKPSVRRALYTLTCLGLAASDGRAFRLTPRIMELASAYLGSNMVSTVVQPACERIGAHYVNFVPPRSTDPFSREARRYYARYRLLPSSDCYRYVYATLRAATPLVRVLTPWS